MARTTSDIGQGATARELGQGLQQRSVQRLVAQLVTELGLVLIGY